MNAKPWLIELGGSYNVVAWWMLSLDAGLYNGLWIMFVDRVIILSVKCSIAAFSRMLSLLFIFFILVFALDTVIRMTSSNDIVYRHCLAIPESCDYSSTLRSCWNSTFDVWMWLLWIFEWDEYWSRTRGLFASHQWSFFS
jgi:hypothetical protein